MDESDGPPARVAEDVVRLPWNSFFSIWMARHSSSETFCRWPTSGDRFALEQRSHHGLSCSRPKFDDGLVRTQRSASTVDRDERAQPLFDLVPLAVPWWDVADPDRALSSSASRCSA